MRHIEASRKIRLQRPASVADLKEQMVASLGKAFEVETVSDGNEKFLVTGTTGSRSGFIRHCRVELVCEILFDGKQDEARLIVSGYSRMARSLLTWYLLLFCFLLIVGLLPGSIETSTETSGAEDALVFLVLGIFIDYDVNKKLAQPREAIIIALDTLETRYG